METRSNHILVGGVVLGLILAVVLFMVWLSQAAGDADKKYDILFKGVEGLAKGSAVTFSGVPVGQVESINLQPQTPEFVRVRITTTSDTPVPIGTTATIKGVGFTGVSQIQLDPPAPNPKAPGPRPEITCPRDGKSAQCPYGVPLIPTKPGALGELLSSAPELIEKVTSLTQRLTELLSDRNQNSIAAILENVQVVSRNLAARSPEIAATLADARIAIRQTGDAVEQMGKLAGTSNDLLARDARPLVNDLRQTVRAAETSMHNLDAVVNEARPGVQAFSKQTIPEVGQLVRDLREMSNALSSVAQKLDQQGAGGVIGGTRLPDYQPGKR
jgi:phospholipid/cholesterol/gamma-HCH transport system substrate-binding protein